MKSFLNVLFILAFVIIGTTKSNAELMDFETALNASSNKPMMVLVYANWADNYLNYVQQFKTVQQTLGNQFNYVEMNIADKSTKSFNDRYHIYPKLPYILLFKDSGKISRYVQRDCAQDSECVINKAKSFLL